MLCVLPASGGVLAAPISSLSMPPLPDSLTIMRLNERRQQAVIAEIADEYEHIPEAEGGGTVAFKDGVDWLCQAIGCGLDSPLATEGVQRIAAFLSDRDARPSMDVTDLSGQAAFATLAGAGMVLEHIERVYALDLHEPLVEPDVPGLRIEALDMNDEDALRALVQHRVEGFTEPGAKPTPGEIEAAHRSQTHPRSRGFTAFIDGQLAGSCGMEVMELAPAEGMEPIRMASLWGAVVGEPYRRRGIQQALIACRLEQGRAEGCTLAVIESEPGIATARNAQRLGFSLAYTRLGMKAPSRARTSGSTGQ